MSPSLIALAIDQVNLSFPCMNGGAAGDSLGQVSNQPDKGLPVSRLKYLVGGTSESRSHLDEE